MQINLRNRWSLVLLLLLATCFLATYARGRGGGGRGGGSRGGSSRSSPSRSYPSRHTPRSYPTSRPAPRPAPAPAPAPKPSPRPASRPSPRPQPPSPRPAQRPATQRPQPASPKPPSETVVTKQPAFNPNFKENNPHVGSADKQPAQNPNFKENNPHVGSADKQPAQNPNFKENNPNVGSADKQPAYNPNYKPEGGPPPPYSPAGQPAPNVPGGAPPPYQPNQPSAPLGQPPPYGSPGQRPPYPPPGAQPGIQPPPYPGQPGIRPPAYPGQGAPYPVQPGYPGGYPQQPGYPGGYPQQPGGNYPHPGGYPQQPGANRPYPVQPGYPGGYPQQPGVNRPYPVQPGYPGNYHQQPGVNRPYPVQPGAYPQQPLGGNVWQPQSGRPAPAYMNYGGIPTGTNMYTKPHKQKGFLGSLMSMGKNKHKPPKQHKYYGSHPSPYGVGAMGGGGMGHMGGGFMGKHGSSAAMYTILPYMAAKKGPKLFKPRFGSMPMFIPIMLPSYHHHYGYGHGMYPHHAHYYDVYGNDYAGRCQRPIKKENIEIRCKSGYEDIKCDAKCEDGYRFPENITLISNKCWHMTGVWRPTKNFPSCTPVCDEGCMNGGQCLRPGVCSCQPEFRGDRCQFHFLNCDVRVLTKGEKVGWVCNHFKNETLCKISCKSPAEFESPPATEYKCTPNGVWTPSTLPHCGVKEKGEADSTVTGV